MDALKRGNPVRAAYYFKRSARYADKASQAAYAEMLWEGRGIERDRALAYVWMDLAAERDDSPLVSFRERYWAGLDEAERVHGEHRVIPGHRGVPRRQHRGRALA